MSGPVLSSSAGVRFADPIGWPLMPVPDADGRLGYPDLATSVRSLDRHLGGSYLHDGRATTLRDAVLLHRSEGSEANDSIERFERLSTDDQARLLDFVATL